MKERITNRNKAGVRAADFFKEHCSAVLLAANLCFYLFFALWDGVIIAVDSESYIGMESSREPLYPLLLAAFRAVFSFAGENFYLSVVVVAQSVLCALAAWSLVNYLRGELRLCTRVTLLLAAMPPAVSLLCRFAAGRASMYSNSILTEGIAIPLYMLFFRYLLEYCLHRTGKSRAGCLVLSFLLVSTRKQMVFALALWMLCVFAGELLISRKDSGRPGGAWNRFLRGLAAALLSAALVLGGNTCLDLAYNYLLRGEAVTHTSDIRFLTTMAVYTADREDADYIEDEAVRELFLSIYDTCDEQGFLMNSAGDGWLSRVTHFGDHYDQIQIDTLWPAVNRFVEEQTGGDTLSVNRDSDDVMNIINAAVLPRHPGRLLRCFADNFLSGLVTTVAQRKPVLIAYTVLVYLLYAALLVRSALRLRRRRKGLIPRAAAESGGEAAPADAAQNRCGEPAPLAREEGVFLTALLTLLSICCNVGLVSAVIFCQSRYTIYNMALFYISLILLLMITADTVREGRNERIEAENHTL